MTKPARKSRAKPVELSHAAIGDAALALIDRDGLDAFSIRKLGAKLGCEGMALYWYYRSKDALLDAVVERLMATAAATLEKQPRDWVAALRAVATSYRRIAHDHPNAFPLLATRRFSSEGTYQFLERLFELARAQGLDDKTTARYYRIVSSYCNGFALSELAAPRGPQDPQSAALRRKFPHVTAVSAWLEAEHLDEIFAFGLEVQLESLARGARP